MSRDREIVLAMAEEDLTKFSLGNLGELDLTSTEVSFEDADGMMPLPSITSTT